MGPFRELVPWEALWATLLSHCHGGHASKSTLVEKRKVPGLRPHRQRNEDGFWQPHRSFQHHVVRRGGWSASESPRDGEGWGVRGGMVRRLPQNLRGPYAAACLLHHPRGSLQHRGPFPPPTGTGACGRGGEGGSGNRRRVFVPGPPAPFLPPPETELPSFRPLLTWSPSPGFVGQKE